jgi:hypothetical protein
MITTIEVPNSEMVLMIDLEEEKARREMYLPVLEKYGKKKRAGAFDYRKYRPLNPMDRCFDNAMETANRHGLKYVEGLCLFDLGDGTQVSVAHGWCETEDGQIVDATSHKTQNHPAVSYHGVAIKTLYSEVWRMVTGYYGCLDGTPKDAPIGPRYDDPEAWLA